MHDSCGSAAFCHSEGAKGEARFGAPRRLDFDMLPLATGWPSVVTHSKAIWASVLDGSMPPEGEGQRAVSNGNWSFDPAGRAEADRLPSLSTRAGKAVLRNWLACGAPVVGDTVVPPWTRAPVSGDAGALSDWSALFSEIIAPRCATAGCHNTQTKAGGLSLNEECAAYAALLEQDACGTPRLIPSDSAAVLLRPSITCRVIVSARNMLTRVRRMLERTAAVAPMRARGVSVCVCIGRGSTHSVTGMQRKVEQCAKSKVVGHLPELCQAAEHDRV